MRQADYRCLHTKSKPTPVLTPEMRQVQYRLRRKAASKLGPGEADEAFGPLAMSADSILEVERSGREGWQGRC